MTATKICSKCREAKSLGDFAKHGSQPDGLQVWCRECHGEFRRAAYRKANPLPPPLSRREQASILRHRKAKAKAYAAKHRAEYTEAVSAKKREWRIANADKVRKYRRDYYKNNTDKVRAHMAVMSAVKEGVLTPGQCEVCGSTKYVDGHHDDYSKPLDVRWLCRLHHKEVHAA